MDAVSLVDEIRSFLAEKLKNFDFQTKKDTISKPPSVYSGYLPEKDYEDEEEDIPDDYPFVIVQYLSDDEKTHESVTYNLQIIVGVFDHSVDGWRDVLRLMTEIKRYLIIRNVIKSFTLKDDIKSKLFEEQLHPFWHGVISLDFEGPGVAQERSDILG